MAEVLMYTLELESRCMANITACEETVSFLVGTQNMKAMNEICHVSLDGMRLVAKTRHHTPGEVRAIASDPRDETRFATGASDYGKMAPSHSLNLFRIENSESDKLEQIVSVKKSDEVKSLEWDSQGDNVAIIHNKNVEVCDVERQFEPIWSYTPQGPSSVAVWSPHSGGNVLGVPVGHSIMTLDLRTKGEVQRIKEAHSLRATYLDFNPNLQHSVVSCGRDGVLRIWDWRNSSSPLFSLRAHAHWATQVYFHSVHDELLLSSGTDGSLLLTSAYSVSSDSKEPRDEEGECRVTLPDGPLERIDEHEDSIYACAWSTADPWTFASLSFDGRIIISHVNREHKYALMKL
ncbi:hypothetical protein PENTCL1PPCAC_19975 [Pristionchus entomophagus]|uniref:EIPR1-like beta-propeller domain-containing protein n=1 Tax=Pristionchus entomophagus TaxID=358040 RepID=A0AAV5TU56_9BILA|nr:hypothetical protein PENTCL1PPCAC_19975 [Pristionchus entomophagus]